MPPPIHQLIPMVAASETPVYGEDGEGDNCTICFEAWTTAGEHRLSALRCGHLFGFTCISRWLKAQGSAAKCPQVSTFARFVFTCCTSLPDVDGEFVCLQCNKKAKRSDIVLLYAPKLRALDTSEQESLKK